MNEKDFELGPGAIMIGFPDEGMAMQAFDGLKEFAELSAKDAVAAALVPLNERAELSGTVNLTDEQADAFRRLISTTMQIATSFVEVIPHVIASFVENINVYLDEALEAANDNPKWWHYYKHAKKWRTRKKYRNKLMRQLREKLEAEERKEKEAKD